MRKPIFLLALLSIAHLLPAPAAFATEVYKTVDQNGNVIYTDTPKNANSEKVEVREPIVVPATVPTRTLKPQSQEPQIPTEYKVTIVQPTPETHLLPGNFHLPIQVSTEPNVHADHSLIIYDNGEAIEGNIIQYIIRGSHAIHAEVVNKRGKVLGTSAPVTVYVHRPGRLSPPQQRQRSKRSPETQPN